MLAITDLFSERLSQLNIRYAQDLVYDQKLHGQKWISEDESDDSDDVVVRQPAKRRHANMRESERQRAKRPLPGFTKVYIDAHDGEEIIADRVDWAISRKVPIGHTYTNTLRGERCLYPVGAEKIIVSEPLYTSRVDSDSGAAIDDKRNSMLSILFRFVLPSALS